MARIDFHSNVSDKLEYACRLTRKIWSATAAGEPVRNIVMVGEKADLKRLDELLWTFGATDLLPHCFIDDEAATDTPILLTEHYITCVDSAPPCRCIDSSGNAHALRCSRIACALSSHR